MEKRTLNLKDSVIALIISFVACQLMVLFGTILISTILSVFKQNNQHILDFLNGPVGYFLTSLFQFSAFVGVFIYYSRKTTVNKACFSKKINVWQMLIFILLGIVTMFALNQFINYYCLTLNFFDKPSSTFSYKLNGIKSYIFSIISLAILPAIGEELIFRGIIFNGLKQKNTLFAVIVSSLFFSLFHFNLSQLFYPFFFGLLLGFVYNKTKNIFATMIIHFINNSVNLTIQYFSNTSIFKPSTLNLILMIIGAIVFIAILSYFFISSYKDEKSNYNDTQVLAKHSEKSLKTAQDKIIFFTPLIFMIILYIIIA